MAAIENQLAFGGSRQYDETARFANDQRPVTFGMTPGGTFYATTPRGTRITYGRDFLITCQNSPLSKSVPKNLPAIDGVTVPIASKSLVTTDKKTAANRAANAGNRIKYDRDFLLGLQFSPFAMKKPEDLPQIPGVTIARAVPNSQPTKSRSNSAEDSQFDMEM